MIRALIVFAVLAGSVYFTVTQPARLGLDLRGGSQIVLETQDSPTAKANTESTDRALGVLRRRIDALGVAEASMTRSGERRIIIELPDVQDPTRAAEVVGKTAQLTVNPLISADPEAKPDAKLPAGQTRLPDEDGTPVVLGPPALTGDGVGKATAGFDQQNMGGWYVTVDFRGDGGKKWQQVTAKAACAPVGDDARRIAFVLDGKVISSPQVVTEVACNVGMGGGSTQITGQFAAEEAKDLAALIQGGSLPVPVKIIEQRVVGPTLGDAAIDASAKAAVIGIILTGLFIVWIYRLVGFLATVALTCYALISYAALVMLGATLTLPGLAGFVLAIGMAVDANVLAFERAREEYSASRRKGLRGALVTGFEKAWSAVADSNITTLLAAGLLFFLASGPVRGFGVTLFIGVIASMFSAMVITRMLTEWAMNRKFVNKRPKLTGIGATGRIRDWLDRRDPQLMKRAPLWLGISAVLLALAFTGIFVRGLNFGVEFTGGRLIEYSTSKPVNADTAREAVVRAGFPRAVVQSSGDDDISVRTEDISNAEEKKIQQELAVEGGQVTKQRDELIGPSLGDELRQKAIIALGVALLVQLAYLAIRFRWTFGAGAVAGMFHDVVIVLGVFAWLGKSIDGVFLAAMLTIIGYSVNDSVVVFDRVRELWLADSFRRKAEKKAEKPAKKTVKKGAPEPDPAQVKAARIAEIKAEKANFGSLANRAALQTMPRTVNTGMGTIFILAALALLGGSSLTDFAIALLIGIIVGTYSSVFTAMPLSIILERRSATPAPQPKVKTSVRERADSGAVV